MASIPTGYQCRRLPCRHARAEAAAEMVALAWQWFVRLVDPRYPSA
jgi:hypothetical protein